MKWNSEFLDESLVYEPRRKPLQQRVKQFLLIMLLLMGLYFLAVHPWGQSLVTMGKTAAETSWHFGEEQFVRFFGPELILRQRAKHMYKTLQDELPQLEQIEKDAIEKVELLQAQLPPLLQQQVAMEEDLRGLLDEEQVSTTPQATTSFAPPVDLVHTTQYANQLNRVNLSTQVITYGALQAQIATYQRALRLNDAAIGQVQALESEVQRQLIGIETTLNLFATRMADRSDATRTQGLSDEELWALRSTLALQLTHAQTLRSECRTIENTLHAVPLSPMPTQEIQTASP